MIVYYHDCISFFIFAFASDLMTLEQKVIIEKILRLKHEMNEISINTEKNTMIQSQLNDFVLASQNVSNNTENSKHTFLF